MNSCLRICLLALLFVLSSAAIKAQTPADGIMMVGAETTYSARKLRGGFKVPTLRNIARTAPYMHSGAFASLQQTVEFYNKGRGNAVPKGVDLQLHWHIVSPDLTEYEVARLVDFLGTLTDEAFMPTVPDRVPSGLHPLDTPGRAIDKLAATPSHPRGARK